MGRAVYWRGKTLNKPLFIGNIYRQPKENLEFYNQFIKEFATILVKITSM